MILPIGNSGKGKSSLQEQKADLSFLGAGVSWWEAGAECKGAQGNYLE